MTRSAVLISAAFLFTWHGSLLAQAPGSAALSAKQVAMMQPLAWMDGRWRGEAVIQSPGGEIKLTQTERVGPMLGGAIRVIEGRGFDSQGKLAFNAAATMVYDPATEKYAMHAFSDGRVGVFKLDVQSNGYAWETPAGTATIRYTAVFQDGVWTETGDFVLPGAPPRPFFVMKLRRIGSTKWPSAGGVARK